VPPYVTEALLHLPPVQQILRYGNRFKGGLTASDFLKTTSVHSLSTPSPRAVGALRELEGIRLRNPQGLSRGALPGFSGLAISSDAGHWHVPTIECDAAEQERPLIGRHDVEILTAQTVVQMR